MEQSGQQQVVLTVGVLAIQGAVEEHMHCIRRLGHHAKEVYL